jgi:hypothetical protein
VKRPASPGIFGNLSVPGARAGAIVLFGLARRGGLVPIACLVIPLARPFILGTAGLGTVVGLILWRKHTRSCCITQLRPNRISDLARLCNTL